MLIPIVKKKERLKYANFFNTIKLNKPEASQEKNDLFNWLNSLLSPIVTLFDKFSDNQ